MVSDIEQLEKEKQSIQEKNSRLNSVRLELADGQKIIKIARRDIGMIFPDSELIPLQEKYHESDLR